VGETESVESFREGRSVTFANLSGVFVIVPAGYPGAPRLEIRRGVDPATVVVSFAAGRANIRIHVESAADALGPYESLYARDITTAGQRDETVLPATDARRFFRARQELKP
jgi:hypothetical protein